MLIPFLGSILGCTGASGDTADKETNTTESDADTDTDSDTDTDTTAPTGNLVSGGVSAYDGSTLSGMAIQICDIACYSSNVNADGSFAFEGIPAGEYKIDAVGESLGSAYGHSRVPYTVVDGDNTLPWAVYVSEPGTAGTVTSGTHTFGTVFWTVNATDLTLPLGYDTYDFNVGVADLATVPDYWGIGGSFAVTFMPFDTSVDAPFSIGISGQADGMYDVYAVGGHGEAEMVGTASSVGGTVVAENIQPEKLTWLIFAPQ